MDQYLVTHETITRRISEEEDGWEFSCRSCSYLARYSNGRGVKNLEILDIGDQNARHTNYQTPVDNGHLPFGVMPHDTKEEELDSENWLTPEIRAKLDEITKDLD